MRVILAGVWIAESLSCKVLGGHRGPVSI